MLNKKAIFKEFKRAFSDINVFVGGYEKIYLLTSEKYEGRYKRSYMSLIAPLKANEVLKFKPLVSFRLSFDKKPLIFYKKGMKIDEILQILAKKIEYVVNKRPLILKNYRKNEFPIEGKFFKINYDDERKFFKVFVQDERKFFKTSLQKKTKVLKNFLFEISENNKELIDFLYENHKFYENFEFKNGVPVNEFKKF